MELRFSPEDFHADKLTPALAADLANKKLDEILDELKKEEKCPTPTK